MTCAKACCCHINALCSLVLAMLRLWKLYSSYKVAASYSDNSFVELVQVDMAPNCKQGVLLKATHQAKGLFCIKAEGQPVPDLDKEVAG